MRELPIKQIVIAKEGRIDTLITLLMIGFAFIIGTAVGAVAALISMEERKYEEFSNMGSKNNIQTDDKDGI